MVARWIKSDIGQVAPTFGFKIETLLYPSPQDSHLNYTLHLWDIGGQRTIRSYWRNYYEETDGLVFVIDAAAPHRLSENLEELQTLLAQDRLANASVLVLINKQDCSGALSGSEISQILRLEDIFDSNKSGERGEKGKTAWNVFESSVITGMNIDKALAWLVSDIASRIYRLQPGPDHKPQDIIINL